MAATRDVVSARPGAPAFDLSDVEGDRVDGPDGRVGVVTSVTGRADGPLDTIHVVTGLFVVRVTPVPETEILEIDADRRCLLIRTMLRAPVPPNVAHVLQRFLPSARPR